MANNTEIQNVEDTMWALINENTELKQQLYYLNQKVDQMRELLNQIDKWK